MAARLAEISPAAQHMVRLNDTVHSLMPRCSFPKLAEQMDVHEGTATVREAMQFSALLRQPAHVPRSEKEAYVEELIELLELQDLALDEVRNHTRNELYYLILSQSRQRSRCTSKQEIASQYRQLVSKCSRGRCSASPQGRIVNDVVMKQRSDMNHLNNLGQSYLCGKESRNGYQRRR